MIYKVFVGWVLALSARFLWSQRKSKQETPGYDQSGLLNLNFQHDEIEPFITLIIFNSPMFSLQEIKAVSALLQFLDDHGDYPSSMDLQDTLQSAYPSNFYLQVSVLEHTLNVAFEIMNRTGTMQPHMMPKGVIAALSHDIGKVPRNDAEYHPNASIEALENIEEVRTLPYWLELKEAVLMHHCKPTNDLLHRILFEADMTIQRRELAIGFQRSLTTAPEISLSTSFTENMDLLLPSYKEVSS